MTNNELFYFTGKCLTLDENPTFRSTILEKINAGQINWNKFVWLCSNHFILQVIYLKFKSHDLLSEIPESLTAHLKLVHQLNCDRNVAILNQVNDIITTLNKENIFPLFMKGVANQLSGLYKDIGERIIGDIDFLISKEDYLKTIEIMLGQGYKEPPPEYGFVKPDKHYPRLIRKGVPADIEIHNLPVNLSYSKYFNTQMVFRDKETVPTHSGCYVPSDGHKIIQNFIHSQFDHQGYQLAQLSFRDLYDLYLLSKKNNQMPYPIPYPRKAQNYFILSEIILGQSLNFSHYRTKSLSLYRKRFDLYCQYPVLPNLIAYIHNKIYKRYIRNSVLLIFNKSERNRIITRLKYHL